MRLMTVMLVSAALLGPELSLAQTAADSAAIRATALDYIEGWYEGNADRMERALHPHLAKREVLQDPSSRSRLVEVSALDLVQSTRRGVGKLERERRRADVRILDVFGNAAMVKIDATDWVDYLQEIKWNGRWVIINVVWEDRPRQLEGLEPLVDSVMTHGMAADVNRYLRSVKVPASYPQPITPWHLLTHTGGLDELPGRQVASAAELRPLGEFLSTRLLRVRPPGEITSYSSYGMALAGVLVEDVSGLGFETYLSRNIWRPLGTPHVHQCA
jgi:hypothetical protein